MAGGAGACEGAPTMGGGAGGIPLGPIGAEL